MLQCPKCLQKQSETQSIITKKPLYAGGFHLIARCCFCNAFIKNLPHSKGQDKLYFGKYRGSPLADIAKQDIEYLLWLLNQSIKEPLKIKIHEAIEKEKASKKQNKLI